MRQPKFVVAKDGNRLSKAIPLARAIRLFERVQQNNPDSLVQIKHA